VEKFQVELRYLVNGFKSMKNKGKLELQLPYCEDLKIQQLYISLYVPDDYKFGEFEGLREVDYFSGAPNSLNKLQIGSSKSFYFTDSFVKSSITIQCHFKEIQRNSRRSLGWCS